MAGRNPYEILRVARDATASQIEDAYDRLFDRYEPKALEGDAGAVEMLNLLNEARDTLVDRKRRAAIDASLEQAGTTRGRVAAAAAQSRTGTRAGPAPQRGQSTTIRTRRRSYPVEQPKARSLGSYLPYYIIALFLVFAIGVGILYLLNNRPTNNMAVVPAGAVVATVNGTPIYQRDWEERITKDKVIALNDPLMGAFFNNFEGITGTRALDLIKFDSLDKLINAEVIMQEAKKEGIYPTPDQAPTLINQAKMADLQSGISFEQFLQDHNITEEQYNKTVVRNAVYQIMANEHMPQSGTPEARTEGWIAWFCEARKKYDVKILVTFIVTQNPSCTSGLPLDVPLPGIDTTAPEAEPTAAAPAGTAAPGTGGTSDVPAPEATGQP